LRQPSCLGHVVFDFSDGDLLDAVIKRVEEYA
jgi:hypothetical protein